MCFRGKVDNLVEEATQLRASVQDGQVAKGKEDQDSIRDLHLKQVTQLRQEISSKQSVIDDLKQ